jgi:hypothetical protein
MARNMATIRDRTSADQRMVIDDGTMFVNRRFEGYDVIVTGQEPFPVDGRFMDEACKITDEGAALTSLYPLCPDLVERLFDGLRGPGIPWSM